MESKLPEFRSDEERHAYAMRKAIERVDEFLPAVVKKCGRDRLLRDFQREILATLPRAKRKVGYKL